MDLLYSGYIYGFESSLLNIHISLNLSRSGSGDGRRKRSPSPKPTKVHIDHLTRNVTKEHVKEIFGNFGTIRSVDFPTERAKDWIGTGSANVDYEKPEQAEEATKKMNGGENFAILVHIAICGANYVRNFELSKQFWPKFGCFRIILSAFVVFESSNSHKPEYQNQK